jgi:phage-related protein
MDDYSNLMTSVSEYNDQFFQFVTELEDAGYSVIGLMTEMYNVSLDAINAMTDATIDASNTLREFDVIGDTASMIASFKYDADAAAEAVNALSDSVTSLLSSDDNPIQGSNLFERDPEAAKAKAVDYY